MRARGRRRHATQREGAGLHRWMFATLSRTYADAVVVVAVPVRLQPPDDGRKQLCCAYCVRARGRHGTARRGFFVAFDRSTIICAPHSGRGPLPLPRPSRPSHIRSSCVPGVCRVWLRDGMVVPSRAENGTGISRSYDTVSAKLI